MGRADDLGTDLGTKRDETGTPETHRNPSRRVRPAIRAELPRWPVVRHCCRQALAKAASDAGVSWAAERENQGDGGAE